VWLDIMGNGGFHAVLRWPGGWCRAGGIPSVGVRQYAGPRRAGQRTAGGTAKYSLSCAGPDPFAEVVVRWVRQRPEDWGNPDRLPGREALRAEHGSSASGILGGCCSIGPTAATCGKAGRREAWGRKKPGGKEKKQNQLDQRD